MTRSGSRPVQIVQITDTHLFADPHAKLLGLNTDYCLHQVVEKVKTQQQPDLIVASGDLTHDGSVEGYGRLREHLSRLDAPVYCLPGNHDESIILKEQLNKAPFYCCQRANTDNGWQLIFLDSTVAGSEGGNLSNEELARLDETLSTSPDTPTLVWLHHQPVPVGSSWLDSMAVDNSDEFFSIIDRHTQTGAVVWGHIHQEIDSRRGHLRLLASPSTCVQFLPGSREFAVDLRPPGYRWLTLHSDGSLETGIERLAEIPGEVDTRLHGY